jgi:hypothetical protein
LACNRVLTKALLFLLKPEETDIRVKHCITCLEEMAAYLKGRL